MCAMATKAEEEQNDLLLEKPLSPVLSNNKMTRKFLHCRRLQKKSRVKLTNRFVENSQNADDTSNSLPNETITFTQLQHVPDTDSLLKKMGEVKVPEKNNFRIANELVEDFTFKKPVSPVVYNKCFKNLQPVNQCSSFKTAGGKSINVTDAVIKQSEQLFSDILCPEKSFSGNSRQNKHAFLAKRKFNSNSICKDESNNFKVCVHSLGDELDIKSNEGKCFVDRSKPSAESVCFGFTTASGKSVLISEVAYNTACKKFVEELPEYKNMIHPKSSETFDEMRDANSDILISTQETNQLFSDFTAVEDQLIKEEKIKDIESFKGFSSHSIQESRKNAEKYKMVILNFIQKTEMCFGKHYLLSVGWSKLRTVIETETLNSSIRGDHIFNSASELGVTMANDGINKKQVVASIEHKTSFAGFSTASGKHIHITESLLNTARNKFGEDLTFENLDMKPLIQSEVTYLNTQVIDEFLSDFPIEEKDKVCKRRSHEQFKGFLEESVQKSREKVEVFMSFFEKYCDEETLLPTTSTRSPLQELHNKTSEPAVFKGGGFTSASGNKLAISKAALERAQEIFKRIEGIASSDNHKDENIEPNAGFKTAAGKSLVLSESGVNRAMQIFSELSGNETSLSTSESKSSIQKHLNKSLIPVLSKSSGFSTASGNRVSVSDAALSRAQFIFKDTEDVNHDGTSSKLQMSSEHRFKSEDTKTTTSFQTAAGHSMNLSEGALYKAKQLFQNTSSEPSLINSPNTSLTIIQNSDVSFGEDTSNMSTKSNVSLNTSVRRKKRLGISSCKPIQIPKHKIEQAMKLFEDEKSTIMSPIRPSAPAIYNSTPLKSVPFVEIESDITPIKNTDSTVVLNPNFECAENFVNDRFTIQDCTKGSIDSWDRKLENEKKILEMKIKLLGDKQGCLRMQKNLMENKPLDQRRRRNGILFDKKQNSERASLQQVLEIDSSLRKRLDITPENAEFLHFNYANQNVTKVHTLDGACVIPNIHSFVGLSEIEPAFKVMEGVDPKLIPSGWIRNHFKWIVWKLASYENFAKNMKDCLTLENVMQQLKYRYDREIDRAERSTLRKIYEMDDAPQKRMVLCVSNIFNLQSGQFELELTDGWYSVRTVIDEPLCKQVTKKKIQIGTKLMICGAELLNCEGCHPLEATDLIRLKINCNSTRRTRWYVKLGYQRCVQPFPLKLHSVFSNGGLIGCVKIFVARVYPVKYMEKQNKLTIWRNRRAEELRTQEWENKRRQDVEKVRETIARDYEISARQSISTDISNDEIRNVHCPETLFTLYQNSKDPEKLQEMLTSSQRKSIVDYQQRLSFIQQQEISRRIEDGLGKLQIPKRDVSSVLQLLVLDVLHPSEKTYVFHIWRPSDVHLDTIKEYSVCYVYNVTPNKNGGFSTMNRTRFQLTSEEIPDFNKYKRTLLTISSLTDLTNKPLFNEFDTVGVVVAMEISDCTQSVWLADSSQKLLYIKIFEGPKTCLLLDKVKIGQIVTASNLIFSKSKLEFGEAIANHLSVISCYPQQRHLQEGINALNEQLPKDLKVFLEQCNQKISYYIDKVDITKHQKSMSSRSLVQSNSLQASDIFDDSSDVLYSMIDVDSFS